MDVGDASGDRVLDRDHAEIGLAVLYCCERILEGRARHRLAAGIDLARRNIGIRPGLTLERDFQFAHGAASTSKVSPGGVHQGPPGSLERARTV